jgi:hypothetical protein
MESLKIKSEDLEKFIEDAVRNYIDKNIKAISATVLEELEDTALSLAIEEGKTGINIHPEEIKRYLSSDKPDIE